MYILPQYEEIQSAMERSELLQEHCAQETFSQVLRLYMEVREKEDLRARGLYQT